MKKHFILLSLICFGLTVPGCIHNYEPVISTISAAPNPVSKGGTVNLICSANDDDNSSILKNESLSYAWFASVGEIISENSDNTAIWTAPQDAGKYSISCSVTDEYDGLDIKTIEIIVE